MLKIPYILRTYYHDPLHNSGCNTANEDHMKYIGCMLQGRKCWRRNMHIGHLIFRGAGGDTLDQRGKRNCSNKATRVKPPFLGSLSNERQCESDFKSAIIMYNQTVPGCLGVDLGGTRLSGRLRASRTLRSSGGRQPFPLYFWGALCVLPFHASHCM